MKRRLGIIIISDELLINEPDAVRMIFSKVIPLRAEHLWHMGAIEYIVMGECLEQVEEGCKPPNYDILIEKQIDQEPKITFRKWDSLPESKAKYMDLDD